MSPLLLQSLGFTSNGNNSFESTLNGVLNKWGSLHLFKSGDSWYMRTGPHTQEYVHDEEHLMYLISIITTNKKYKRDHKWAFAEYGEMSMDEMEAALTR